jgi:ankyrin repeat protein
MMTDELEDASGNTSLMRAVRADNDDEVVRLLQQGADPSYQNRFGYSARLLAGRARLQVGSLMALFPPDVDIKDRDLELNSVLHIACQVECTENAHFFVARGVDTTLLNHNRQTAAMDAARRGWWQLALSCIGPGFVMQGQDVRGWSLLHQAAATVSGDDGQALLMWLLKQGSDPHQPNRAGETPLMMVLKRCSSDVPAEKRLAPAFVSKLAAAMLLLPGNLDQAETFGNTAILFACRAGSFELTRMLIDAGARCDVADCTGLTLLMLAANSGDRSLLTLVLDQQIAVDTPNHNGNTALHYAIYLDSPQSAALLLQHGARCDLINRAGSSIRMVAARHSDSSLLALLLEHEIPIDAQDRDGNTLLHYACDHNRRQCIALLLEHGANWLLANHRHKLPAQCSTDRTVPTLFASWAARQAMLGAIEPGAPDIVSRAKQRYEL